MTRQVWLLSLMSIALLSSSSTIAQERAVVAPPQAATSAIAENRQALERTPDVPQARVSETDFRVLVGDQSAGN